VRTLSFWAISLTCLATVGALAQQSTTLLMRSGQRQPS
jgi:hypothetical protein